MIQTQNSKIEGISVCVPNNLVVNQERLNLKDKEQFINLTGVKQHYLDEKKKFNTSDLCFYAAEDIIKKLQWKKKDINFLIFVSQSRNYILPSTSCILQDRLKLKKDIFTIDIPLGCSGYLYGLYNAFLVSKSMQSKGILLSGDMSSKFINMSDQKYFGLFGDAGSATAIDYSSLNDNESSFAFGTDGSGFKNLIFKSNGFETLSNTFLEMAGSKIFEFAIDEVPKQIKHILDKKKIDINDVDYLILHQANKFLMDNIVKKIKISPLKSLISIDKFGNTNSASIPVTLLNNKKKIKKAKVLISGFGVGYSWASAIINLDNIKFTNLLIK